MITRRVFGTLPSGETIDEYTFVNTQGASLKVITYGGIVTELHLPDRHGRNADVVLGFNDLQSYVSGHPYFGCIAGRVAGRLTRGRFSLDGINYALALNDPPNHLHGGKVGFDKRVWKAELPANLAEAKQLRLTYLSPAGEEGYPGDLQVAVTYSLTDTNQFIVDYEATADTTTPLNLTHHGYFNLAGEGRGSIEDHRLQIFADDYAPTDEAMTLLDRRAPVAYRPNDFTRPKRVGDAIPGLLNRHGDNYFLRENHAPGLAPVARLTDPSSGRVMELSSTEPCVQFYSGRFLDGSLVGKSGRPYFAHAALCLECQRYPNGINTPQLGDILLPAGATYRQTTVHAFSVDFSSNERTEVKEDPK